jgi:hypothetical protein
MNLHTEEQFPPDESFAETSSPTELPDLNLSSCGCPMARSNNGADSEAHDNSGGVAGLVDCGFVAINLACDEPNDSHLQAHTLLPLTPEHPAHDSQQVNSPGPKLSFELRQGTADTIGVWLLDQPFTSPLSECDIGRFYPTLLNTWIEDQGEEHPRRACSPTDSMVATGYGSRPQSSMSNTRPTSCSGAPWYTNEPLQVGSWIESAPRSSLLSGCETISSTSEE